MKTLTTENAKTGVTIKSKLSPEWGTWRLYKDNNGWIRSGRRGDSILSESEFHFWEIVI